MQHTTVTRAGLLSLSVTLICFGSSPTVQGVPIQEINQNLSLYIGAPVEVTGVFVDADTTMELWVNKPSAEYTTRHHWQFHLDLVDDGGMPAGSVQNYDSVVVWGAVTSRLYDYPLVGGGDVAVVLVDSLHIVAKAPPTPSRVGPTGQSGRAADCDSCHFVLVVSGFDQPDYWNDVLDKHRAKVESLKVCDSNFVVLHGLGSRNPGQIPNGTTDGSGNFTSGGVFPSTRANMNRAFTYLKQRMIAKGCDPAVFQFHSTGHGAGYHSANQPGLVEPWGWANAPLDTDGDEWTRISENDLKFMVNRTAEVDLDGDGIPDILISQGPPRNVQIDNDNDGFMDATVGTDTNMDGFVDRDDADWMGPDLNGNGIVDSVAFDDALELNGGEIFSDDELRALFADLHNTPQTGLDREHTRAEFSQCFGGSFNDDMRGVTSESASASRGNELSTSTRGPNGFNNYQRPFMDMIGRGMSWRAAHDSATGQVTGAGRGHNPEYRTIHEVTDVVRVGEQINYVWTRNDSAMTATKWWYRYKAKDSANWVEESHTGELDFRQKHPEYNGQEVQFRFTQPVGATDWEQTLVYANGASEVYGMHIQSNSPWAFYPLEDLPAVDWRIPDLVPASGVNPAETIYTAVNLDLYLKYNPLGFDGGNWEVGQTLDDINVVIVGGQAGTLAGIYWSLTPLIFDPLSPLGVVPEGGSGNWLTSFDYPVDLKILAEHASRSAEVEGGSCCTVRGDANGDSNLNVSDLTFLVNYLFKGGPAPACLDHADVNNDGNVNVADLTYLVNFLFKGGPAPVPC